MGLGVVWYPEPPAPPDPEAPEPPAPEGDGVGWYGLYPSCGLYTEPGVAGVYGLDGLSCVKPGVPGL